MEDNKNNNSNDKYRDFFERDDNGASYNDEQQTHKSETAEEHSNSNSTSYYRYGPFQSIQDSGKLPTATDLDTSEDHTAQFSSQDKSHNQIQNHVQNQVSS